MFPTIGIDFIFTKLIIDSETVNVKIWDTAGQERFNNIGNSFYSKCQGALFVFDVGIKKSFYDIHKWVVKLDSNSGINVVKYLIGNKIDKEINEVSEEEIKEMTEEYNMKYFETSARLNINLTDSIESLIKDIWLHDKKSKELSFSLHHQPRRNSNSSQCCH